MAIASKYEDTNATRGSLLIRLKDWQDHDSWHEFVKIYKRLVYSVALKAGLSETEAEDAVQDTFLAVSKKMPGFDYNPAIGSFRSWLIKNTQWRVADQLRKRKHQAPPRASTLTEGRTATIDRIPDTKAPDLNELCEQEWKNAVYRIALEKVKKKVSAKQFQLFDLYVTKDWKPKKVADAFGVSVNEVYLAKKRVGDEIKEQIKLVSDQSF